MAVIVITGFGLSLFPGIPRSIAFAANGDVLSVSGVLAGTDLSDLALDTGPAPSGGTFWVLGKLSGKIYHLSADFSTVLGQFQNPHGTGTIVKPILSWGISYRASTKSVFILAQDGANWRVKEVKTTDGSEDPAGAFSLTPPDPLTAGLHGLTFDVIARGFWCLDMNNDKVLFTDLSGVPDPDRTFSLPGDVPPETTLRGDGLSWENEDVGGGVFEPRIYVAYGDIFRKKPSRIIQLTPAGRATGVEVPLDKVTLPTPQGFQTYRLGLQRRVAIVSQEGKIAVVEQVIPKPPPPSLLKCSLTLTNQVDLSWQNNGSGPANTYQEIQILRNGVPFTTAPGDTTSFTDTTPLEGTSTYSLKGSSTDGTFSPPNFECKVTVGTSGIVRWVPFVGSSIYDCARDPATGILYVTDNIGVQTQGKIYKYDSALNLLGEVPSPWQRPGAIAFIPRIQIQAVTLDNVLAVGRTDGMLVKLIDPVTGAEKTTFPLEARGVATPLMGGLAFLPNSQMFAFEELSTNTIFVDDRNGRFDHTCKPSDLLGLPPMDMGVTYDPIQNKFLAVFQKDAFQESVVREVETGGVCQPTGFNFSLASLGEGFDELPGFLGGIEISGNTLIVCGTRSHAIFQVLIFPAGPAFRRGDFDRSDLVNISDAVASARYLFQSGSPPTCQDAADTNDDGVLDLSDPVYLLFHLFLLGPPPPAPFPEAGQDPTFRDNLGCE